MYAHINGIVADKAENTLVIDCGGVGYLMTVSGATLALAPSVGEKMKCFTHLSVREDALELFGFATREEKTMFLKLTSVSGVGAKSAIGILSALSVRDLSLAIVTGDAAALSRAPGVGKKTAQRLILELKDKVDDAQLTGQAASISPKVNANGPEAEAIAALISLGYSNSEAAKAVAQVADQTQEADKLIFLALKGLGG